MFASIEKKLEEKLGLFAKENGGLSIKFFCPTFTGLPDRLVMMPKAKIYFVELKDVKKKPTQRQQRVHRILKKLGFPVWTINNFDILELFKTTVKNDLEIS